MLYHHRATALACHHHLSKSFLKPISAGFRLLASIAAILFLLAPSTPAAQVIQSLPFYDSFDYNQGTGLAGASSTVWETCFSTANIQTTATNLTLAGFV